MTRKQVAEYLGKSIATVRRAEGRHLHPRRDARGTRRFDPEEVRNLRTAIERGEVRLTVGTFGSRGSCPRCSIGTRITPSSVSELAELRRDCEDLRVIGREAVKLFFAVCPAKLLEDLEPGMLDCFEALLNDTRYPK